MRVWFYLQYDKATAAIWPPAHPPPPPFGVPPETKGWGGAGVLLTRRCSVSVSDPVRAVGGSRRNRVRGRIQPTSKPGFGGVVGPERPVHGSAVGRITAGEETFLYILFVRFECINWTRLFGRLFVEPLETPLTNCDKPTPERRSENSS